MRIIDIPEIKNKGSLFTMSKQTLVLDAVEQMRNKNYGCVLITENEKLIGIFTERDVLIRVVADKKDPSTTTLEEVMTLEVQTANIEDGVLDSLKRMSEGRFRHLPIVDSQGRPVSLASQGDFVATTWNEIWYRLGQQAKASFLTHTQVWVLLVALVLYTVLMAVIFKFI